MTKRLFSKGQQVAENPLSNMVAGLTQALTTNGTGFVSAETTRTAISLESADYQQVGNLNNNVEEFCTQLRSIATEAYGTGHTLTAAQVAAGGYAAAVTGDIQTYIATPVAKLSMEGIDSVVAISNSVSATRPTYNAIANEAFSERDTRTAAVYGVTYNMNAAVQDEVGEALFPTVAIPANDIGLVVSARLMQVMKVIKRQTSGAVDQYNRKNLIRAVIDPTILNNEANKIVPIARAPAISQGIFVDAADVAVRNINLDGESIATAPLAVNKSFSLLGVSQTDASLEGGNNDQTDELDTAVSLKKIYVKVVNGADKAILGFDTSFSATSVFAPAAQGLSLGMNLNFVSETLAVTKNTKTVQNTAPAGLTLITSSDVTVRLALKMNGSVNLETSETELTQGGAIRVVSVTGTDGVQLASNDPTFTSIATLFATSSIIGYDLDAQRTNSNLRQIDQLLTTSYYNQLHVVGWRNPIAIQRPLNADATNDTSDLGTLITTTRLRTSAAAITTLFRIDAVLNEYAGAYDTEFVMPEIFGAGRFLLAQPHYNRDTLNVLTSINTLESHNRARDISAVLLNMIRAKAYDALTKSGYKAAADSRAGGTAQNPTLIIATDLNTARYLMIEGETRVAGILFDVKVVATQDKRMAGKIFLTFGDPAVTNQNEPSPLHFGTMAWKPEMPVIVTPMHRQGSTHKQLTVAPAFQHFCNMPLLVRIDVSNLPETSVAKIAVNFHTV